MADVTTPQKGAALASQRSAKKSTTLNLNLNLKRLMMIPPKAPAIPPKLFVASATDLGRVRRMCRKCPYNPAASRDVPGFDSGAKQPYVLVFRCIMYCITLY